MSKKVSAATVKAILRASEQEPVTLDYPFADMSVEIIVKPYLSFADRCRLVMGAADMCFTDDLYQPYMYPLAWGYQLLHHYTNLSIPSKAEQVWTLISRTDLLARLTAVIRDDLTAIQADIRESIRARLSRSKGDDAADSLSGLLAKMQEMDSGRLVAAEKEDTCAPKKDVPAGKILFFTPAAGQEKS